jgi:hypothetical protein
MLPRSTRAIVEPRLGRKQLPPQVRAKGTSNEMPPEARIAIFGMVRPTKPPPVNAPFVWLNENGVSPLGTPAGKNARQGIPHGTSGRNKFYAPCWTEFPARELPPTTRQSGFPSSWA